MDLPKILAMCVIRSRVRKRYDGGMYLVDLNNRTVEQKLDWNLDTIEFPEHLGDIGLRHGVHWNNNLYCSSSREILVFNHDFQLIKKFIHPYLMGTHQLCIRDNKLYTIANQFDAILEFDLIKEDFTRGFIFSRDNSTMRIFDPNKDQIEKSDTLHLDMVSIRDDHLWFGGSQHRDLIGFNLKDYSLSKYVVKLVSKWGGHHNCQWWNGGIVYTLSDEGLVCFQKDGRTHIWETPLTQGIVWSVSSDFAKAKYTRGMVLTDRCIITGSSPARVDVIDIESKEKTPLISVEISKNIVNSVCGLCKYEE